jgi:NAD(P)-dependent dehydrogenase (short-subunit alcohol dehydrogenase family)
VGATSGIGRAIAVRLAKEKVNVIVVGRSTSAGAEVVQELKAANPEGEHAMVQCDASLLRNVQATCAELKTRIQRLDYLVLTQGIATTAGRTENAEGIDTKMCLHYYSRMAFIVNLLPVLRQTVAQHGDARVLSVLSAGVHSTYTKWDDLELKHNFSLSNAANAAGFYNDLGLDALSQDPANAGISFVHAAPGFVKTQWGREMPLLLRGLVRAIQVFAKSPADCADSLVTGLHSAPMRGGFRLMSPSGGPAKPTKDHSAEARDRVWRHTLELLQRAPASA